MGRLTRKKGGIVGNLIAGVGSLIVVVIIVLMIVSSILDAGMFSTVAQRTIVNSEGGWNNITDYQLGTSNASRSGYTLIAVSNASDGAVINLANFTITASTGIITNATFLDYLDVDYNYSYGHRILSNEQLVTEDMSTNLTEGIQNISEKIPTILLIGAVVLLFGIIVLLLKQSKAMGVGSGSGL